MLVHSGTAGSVVLPGRAVKRYIRQTDTETFRQAHCAAGCTRERGAEMRVRTWRTGSGFPQWNEGHRGQAHGARRRAR